MFRGGCERHRVICIVGIASGLNDQLAVSRPDRRSSQKTIGLSRSAPHIPDPFVLPTHETVITPDADLLDRVFVEKQWRQFRCSVLFV